MVKYLTMRLIQSQEFLRSKGWSAFFKELAFVNREAIMLEKDLVTPLRSKHSFCGRSRSSLSNLTPILLENMDSY